MAGGKSTQQANDYLTYFFTTGAAPTRPTGWTLGLFTDSVVTDGQGNPIYVKPTTEATASACPGYARQTINFNAPSNGSASSSNDVAFTATGAWTNTATYYGVFDNTGTMKEWCPLSTSRKPAVNGDKIDFAIGSVVLGEQ